MKVWWLIAGLFLIRATVADAAIRYVNNSSCNGQPTPCYTSIQLAINASSAGDDIRIENAGIVYNENAWSNGVSGANNNPIMVEGADSSGNVITVTGRANLGTFSYSSTPPTWYCVNNGLLATFSGIGNNFCVGSTVGGSGIGIPLTLCQGVGSFCNDSKAVSSNWIIKNIMFDGTGVFTGPSAIWAEGNNQFLTITQNTFKNWGGTAANDITCSNGCRPVTLRANGALNSVVINNIFDGDRYRVLGSNAVTNQNLIIMGNEFKNLTCGYDGSDNSVHEVAVRFVPADNVTHLLKNIVMNNSLHDFIASASCTQIAGSCVGGICNYEEFAGVWFDNGASGNTVDSNLFHDIDNVSQGVAIHSEKDTISNIEENNVIYNVNTPLFMTNCGGGCSGFVTDYNYAYNNTIYNAKGPGIDVRSGWAFLKNNVVSQCTGAQIDVEAAVISQGTHFVSDYNDFFSSNANNIGSWNGGAPTTFATWRINSGGDAHGVSGDPLFSFPGTPPPGGFVVRSGSPAFKAGVAVGGVVADYNGTRRPSPPSMGAVDFDP